MSLSSDVAGIIAAYLAEYKLVDWIDIYMIRWHQLCENPLGLDIVKKSPERINWYLLSKNPNGFSHS
jgi:hypothetical protein